MRSTLAAITAVAFLANASLANAADGPTTPVAGYCVWSPDPVLTELSVVLDDADCASRNAIRVNQHIITNVLVVPAPKGGERVIADVRYVDDPEGRGESLLVMEAYRSYRANATAKTNAIAQSVGSAQVRWFSVGPAWMRNVNATATASAIDYAGGVVADAPLVALLPMIGAAVFVPGIATYFEGVRDAPAGIRRGAGEVAEGVSAGRYDQAAEGVGEVCGGVSVLVSAAIPFVAGAKAIAPRTTPISPFHGRAVPTLESTPAVVAVRGSGPVPGVIEVSDRYSSTKAFQNYDPPWSELYQERTIEYIYDPTTKRFAVGQPKVKTGSGHESLVHVLGANESKVVGGHFSRGRSGQILTNENTGHYHEHWTPEIRREFVEFLESRTGQKVEHSAQ